MKKFVLPLAAAAFAITANVASAGPFEDGTYVAQFGGGTCGVLTIRGSSGDYVAGNCQGNGVANDSDKYTARRVQIQSSQYIRVDKAVFHVRSVGNGSLSGTWKLRGSMNVTFKRV